MNLITNQIRNSISSKTVEKKDEVYEDQNNFNNNDIKTKKKKPKKPTQTKPEEDKQFDLTKDQKDKDKIEEQNAIKLQYDTLKKQYDNLEFNQQMEIQRKEDIEHQFSEMATKQAEMDEMRSKLSHFNNEKQQVINQYEQQIKEHMKQNLELKLKLNQSEISKQNKRGSERGGTNKAKKEERDDPGHKTMFDLFHQDWDILEEVSAEEAGITRKTSDELEIIIHNHKNNNNPNNNFRGKDKVQGNVSEHKLEFVNTGFLNDEDDISEVSQTRKQSQDDKHKNTKSIHQKTKKGKQDYNNIIKSNEIDLTKYVIKSEYEAMLAEKNKCDEQIKQLTSKPKLPEIDLLKYVSKSEFEVLQSDKKKLEEKIKELNSNTKKNEIDLSKQVLKSEQELLESNKKKLEEKVKELSSKRKESKSNEIDLSNQVLKSEQETLKFEKNQIEIELEEQKDEKVRVETEYQEIEDQYNKLVESQDEVRTTGAHQILEREEKIAALEDTITDLKTYYARSDEKIKELTEVNTNQAELQNLLEEYKNMNKKNLQEIEEIKFENQNLNNKIEELTNSSIKEQQKFSENMEMKSNKIQELEQSLEKQRNEIKTVQQEYEGFCAEIEDQTKIYEQDVEKKVTLNNNLASEVDSLKAIVSNLTQENQTLKSKQSDHNKGNEETLKLERLLKIRDANIKNITNDYNTQKSKQDSLTKEKSDLTSKLSSIQDKLNYQESCNKTMANLHLDTEKTLKMYEDQIKTLNTDNDKCNKTIEYLQNSLKDSKVSNPSSINELTKELTDLKEKNQSLEKKVLSLKDLNAQLLQRQVKNKIQEKK